MASHATFQEWFCIADRLSFTIDPISIPGDAQYYFGRSDTKTRLEKQLRRSFVSPGVPKMMIYGPFGSGKTHTLLHLKHILDTSPPDSCRGEPYTAYTAVEMRSNSGATHLHTQIMEALGMDALVSWVRQMSEKTPDLNDAINTLTRDFNIRAALREIRIPGDNSFAAWRWLSGQALKSSELNALRITRNLSEVNTADLAEALVAVGKLAELVEKRLIFLLDELEGLNNVRVGDNANAISQYFRRLAEPGNSTAGFIVAFAANVRDDVPSIIDRGDIRTRIGESNYVEIDNLPAIADVKRFVGELVGDFTRDACAADAISAFSLNTNRAIYPFEEAALVQLAEYALAEPTLALPRLIIHAINECAIQAWDDDNRTIDIDVVHQVAPAVFEPIF
jgi:hypothetical protein